ncbi:MAG: S41 family peptidase [Flavisolibacter sp.]
MRKIFLFIIISLTIQTSYCQKLNENEILRIGDYGRLWVVLTLFHPEMAYSNINADSLYTDNINELLSNPSARNFKDAIRKMIARLGDPYTIIAGDNTKAKDTLQLGNRPLLNWMEDSIAFLHFDDQFIMQNSNEFAPNVGLIHLMESIKKANGIIIDLRESTSVNDEMLKYQKQAFFNELISHLSDHEVSYPSFRTRIHYGHESQTFDLPFYYQGWFIKNSSRVIPKDPAIKKPVCLIINRYNNNISDGISTLQGEGIAKVIAEGDLGNFEPARTYEMDLTDHLKVSIRLSEILYKNGERFFKPNISVGSNNNRLIPEAVKLVKADLRSKVDSNTILAQNIFVSSKVAGYYNMAYPSTSLRLLGLMRFWSAIKYFCPNKDRITKNWDSILYEYVPKFIMAKDSLDYELTAARLIKEINDSHGFFSGPINNSLTEKVPDVQLKFVENKTIIYKIFNDSLKDRIFIGDEVLSINDRSVKYCRDSIAPLIAASNDASLQRNITARLLAGKSGSFVKLNYEHNGKIKKINLPRVVSRYFSPEIKDPVWKKIDAKLGYVDFGRLEVAQIDSMFHDLNNMETIIFDNRSYPKGTVWTLVNYLTVKTLQAAKGITMIADSPDPLTITSQESIWEIPVSPKTQYKGKIIILVNEITQSQAEYSCMVIQATGKKVTIIGSQTAGADGDVTGIVMPGGIQTAFSGHGVLYPNGKPTQGIGIVPDIYIKPTIKGIKAGKDEVLERAILFSKLENK